MKPFRKPFSLMKSLYNLFVKPLQIFWSLTEEHLTGENAHSIYKSAPIFIFESNYTQLQSYRKLVSFSFSGDNLNTIVWKLESNSKLRNSIECMIAKNNLKNYETYEKWT
jgi:hypothetical protein